MFGFIGLMAANAHLYANNAKSWLVNYLLSDVQVEQIYVVDGRVVTLHTGLASITSSPAGVGDVLRWSGTQAALAAGDIGELFPDSDPAYKDADSRVFLREVRARVQAAGYRPVNVDVVIHAEQPKLSPYKQQIKESLATLLGLSPDAVGVKATTNEGLDAVGRGEAIGCWATALLRAADTP